MKVRKSVKTTVAVIGGVVITPKEQEAIRKGRRNGDS